MGATSGKTKCEQIAMDLHGLSGRIASGMLEFVSGIDRAIACGMDNDSNLLNADRCIKAAA